MSNANDPSMTGKGHDFGHFTNVSAEGGSEGGGGQVRVTNPGNIVMQANFATMSDDVKQKVSEAFFKIKTIINEDTVVRDSSDSTSTSAIINNNKADATYHERENLMKKSK